MKNKKCALGLVAILAAAVGLASCDQATPASDGTIFTYTDANGKRTSYTTEDLLGSYRESSSSLSSQFDKIYEVLVRHYYQTSGSSKLATLENEATQEVLSDKMTAQTNATNNGTSYEQEFEAILNSNNVDNVNELWEKHLYEKEKDLFENDLYDNFNLGASAGVNGYEALRDGKYYTTDGVEHKIFDFKDAAYGNVQDGWLLNQMPYEIRHILVKLNSGTNKNYTQDKISEPTATGEGGEVTKLTTVLKGLAGATNNAEGKLVSVSEGDRSSFDALSSFSDDSGSKAAFGEYSKADVGPMTKDQNSELVHEFIYGVYAFESLYNQKNRNESVNPYGAQNAYRIAPGLTQEATALPSTGDTTPIDANLTVLDESGNQETVYDYFNNEGIGSIPFGAVMALADAGKIETDDSIAKAKVNDGNEKFFPRNVIYNKYFNKHNVCVITPNAVAYNATKYYDGVNAGAYRASWADDETITAAQSASDAFYNASAHTLTDIESTDGVYAAQFGALPGFSVDTTDVLPQFTHNVLTDSAGEIVLAVRAGASSYQGIHLITIKRSGLSLYGTTFDKNTHTVKENTLADVGALNNGKITYTADSPSLSDYYSIYTPDSVNYPKLNGHPMSTYVNYNVHDNADYAKRAGWISSGVKSSFSDNISTYLFQYLVENGQIEFSDSELETSIKNYIKIKRQANADSHHETWAKNWKEYAESLVAQNEARAIGYSEQDKTDGRLGVSSTLITEAAAIEYGLPSKAGNPLWQKGGACYYASNND